MYGAYDKYAESAGYFCDSSESCLLVAWKIYLPSFGTAHVGVPDDGWVLWYSRVFVE